MYNSNTRTLQYLYELRKYGEGKVVEIIPMSSIKQNNFLICTQAWIATYWCECANVNNYITTAGGCWQLSNTLTCGSRIAVYSSYSPTNESDFYTNSNWVPAEWYSYPCRMVHTVGRQVFRIRDTVKWFGSTVLVLVR